MESGSPAPSPSGPPARAERERGPRTAWAVIVGVIGAIGLGMLVAGIVAIGAYGLLRDDQGFFTTGDEPLHSAGYAITSGEFDIASDTTGVDLGDVATFELEAEGAQGRPVFLAVGPSDEVDVYLSGVAHSEVDDFNRRGDAVYTQVRGGPPSAPPEAQDFWIAESRGLGRQRIEWELSNRSLTAVAMNADGARGVAIEAEAGIKLDWLAWAGFVIALIGLLLAIACGFGMNRLLRSPSPRPADAGGQS